MLDEANRVESIVRKLPQSQGGDELMRANYDYYANGWLQYVTYLNGAQTKYTYDAAGRLLVIDHRDGAGVSYLKLTYEYNNRDLPTRLTEEAGLVPAQVVETAFYYDARGRLIDEVRNAPDSYIASYDYDLGGNRTRKFDYTHDIEILYEYDINDAAYGTANNRLKKYVTCDMSAPGAICDLNGGSTALVSTTSYVYNAVGNVTRVVTKKADPQGGPQYSSVWLKYAKNGQTVSYAIGETWDDDCANTYEITYAREFRYDGARQRYLNRVLDPVALEAGNVVVLNETWTDYDGDAAYADYTVSGPDLTQTAIYEPGLGRSFDPTNTLATQYYHADQIGTTRLMTDTPGAGASPNVVSESAFTAFGEKIGGTTQRYGYAGAYGYQTDNSADGFPFLHVGARYYDPATGRFLQRDPTGIRAGLNVYAYVLSRPTSALDPNGLRAINDDWGPLPGVPRDEAERQGVAKGAGVATGIIVGVGAPGVAGSCAWAWGVARYMGFTTGNQGLDDAADSLAIGAGTASAPGFLRSAVHEIGNAIRAIQSLF